MVVMHKFFMDQLYIKMCQIIVAHQNVCYSLGCDNLQRIVRWPLFLLEWRHLDTRFVVRHEGRKLVCESTCYSLKNTPMRGANYHETSSLSSPCVSTQGSSHQSGQTFQFLSAKSTYGWSRNSDQKTDWVYIVRLPFHFSSSICDMDISR